MLKDVSKDIGNDWIGSTARLRGPLLGVGELELGASLDMANSDVDGFKVFLSSRERDWQTSSTRSDY